MVVKALTNYASGIANSIITPVKIEDPVSLSVLDTFGIWDTGATNSVITKTTAKALGLKPVSYTKVRGVGGEMDSPVYRVRITLNNQDISIIAQVTECEELSVDTKTGMLIGMNVISMGDFSVSNFEGRTVMTFRVPSLQRIDYVEEINQNNTLLKQRAINLAHNLPDKCPCGSGKLFKNCHGNSIYNK